MIICDICKKEYRSNRNIVLVKGKFVCGNCRYNKTKSLTKGIPRMTISEEEALSRTYVVKPLVRGHSASGYVYFPRVLIGKKFKLNLIDEKEVKDETNKLV